MRFDVITLFPPMFQALNYGILQRAQTQSLIEVHCWNPRDFTHSKQGQVDDRPYGGGPGMVMMAQPIEDAILAAKKHCTIPANVIYLSPQGIPVHQTMLRQRQDKRFIFLCGRYEGIDERLMERVVDEEWSLGDYVLSGGEFAAMAFIDALARLQPGVLGHEDSAEQDSFSHGLLDHPHYTRPEIYEGLRVPEVLLSGDHQAIQAWRKEQAHGRTMARRPDLLRTSVESV